MNKSTVAVFSCAVAMSCAAMVKPLEGPWLNPGEKLVCFGDSITAGKNYYIRFLRLALETNGVRAPSCAELFDYISVSPKPDYFARYMDNIMIREANEVRIVATTDEIVGFCRSMRARIKATDYYISPLETDGRMHYRRALNLLMKLKKTMPDVMPPWSLSIQMHKVIGVR